MGGGPTDVIQGDGPGAGFGAGGIDGADAQVIRPGGQGPLGLGRVMGGEPELEGPAGRAQFGDLPVAGVKKIFLPQMAEFRAEVAGDIRVVVDDQADAGGAGDGQDGFGEPANFGRGGVFGAQLDEVGPALAQLAGDERGVAAVQKGGVNERVQAAVRQWFHAGRIEDQRVKLKANH